MNHLTKQEIQRRRELSEGGLLLEFPPEDTLPENFIKVPKLGRWAKSLDDRIPDRLYHLYPEVRFPFIPVGDLLWKNGSAPNVMFTTHPSMTNLKWHYFLPWAVARMSLRGFRRQGEISSMDSYHHLAVRVNSALYDCLVEDYPDIIPESLRPCVSPAHIPLEEF